MRYQTKLELGMDIDKFQYTIMIIAQR